MPYGLYLSAAGADVQSKRLEVMANNLANVDTAGFKRELAVVKARHAEAIERGDAIPGQRSLNDVGGGVLLHQTLTHFSPGTLKKTGVPTDMAIDGEGFFVIAKGNERLLTRAGAFSFSAEGRLVTQDGYEVIGDDGAPLAFDPTGPAPRILPDGAIAQGPEAGVAPMIVKPQSIADLAKTGENRFLALAGTTPVAADERKVRSGFIEQSNVSATQGMLELIEASRAYEANVRMIQNHDQLLGALLGRVLRP